MKKSLSLSYCCYRIIGILSLLACPNFVYGQNTTINLEVSPVSISFNHPSTGSLVPFGTSFGLNTILNWNLKYDLAISTGLTVNKLSFRGKSADSTFPADILANTQTAYVRKMKLNEIGLLCMLEGKIRRKNSIRVPTIGVGISWLFLSEEYRKKQGSGPTVIGDMDAQDWTHSFNLYLGWGWQWPLPHSRQFGIRPVYILRYGVLNSEVMLGTPPFRPQTIAIEFFLKNLLGKKASNTLPKT